MRLNETGSNFVPYTSVPDRGMNVPMVSGIYYDISTHGIGNAGASTTAAVAGQFSCMPILIPRTVTIDRIGVETTTGSAGGTTCRVGIYTDLNGVPSALVAGTDAGTIATDAIAVVENTISVVLVPGWYWLANTFQSTPTMRSWGTVTEPKRIGYAVNTAPAGLDNAARTAVLAYAALPAAAPTTTLSATAADMLRVFIRAA